jgi:hypothetical protein
LHHTLGLPDFSQEYRCFKEVTCAQVWPIPSHLTFSIPSLFDCRTWFSGFCSRLRSSTKSISSGAQYMTLQKYFSHPSFS